LFEKLNFMHFFQSMPTVPDKSRLLTKISVEDLDSVEVSQDREIEPTSQATSLLLDLIGVLFCCLLSCKNSLY